MVGRREPSRRELRRTILRDLYVRQALVHYATEGLIDTRDLWWFYTKHRIMAPADAWLLAMLWEDALTEDEAELLANPSFWGWFDAGRH